MFTWNSHFTPPGSKWFTYVSSGGQLDYNLQCQMFTVPWAQTRLVRNCYITF